MLITNEQIINKEINKFITESRFHIITSRFNNKTWEENENYRSIHKKIGCIYCSPSPITSRVSIDSVVFILEMNNDINKIIGIGMVKNHPQIQKYSVYENGNYNRYTFTGKYRIDRIELTEQEDKIMKIFDMLCFKGNRHMKRGQGLQLFPAEILYNLSSRINLVDCIEEMFKNRFYPK